MSKRSMTVLMCHRHKILDPIYITSMDLVYIQSSGNSKVLRSSWLRLQSSYFSYEMQGL
jgi:hypothetical protein